ncbi:MAG: hypothetical protein M0Z28_15835 [Rhodospirillales bacterium]|nr:hypothetical protein [Rhodospirillales bacterium]
MPISDATPAPTSGARFLDVHAEDGMTLEQLMVLTVSNDHAASSNGRSYAPARTRSAAALTLPIEPCSDQYDPGNQSASAKERRDDVRSLFRRLKLQVSDLGHVLGLVGLEHGDREPEQPDKNQNRPADRQYTHCRTSHESLQ